MMIRLRKTHAWLVLAVVLVAGLGVLLSGRAPIKLEVRLVKTSPAAPPELTEPPALNVKTQKVEAIPELAETFVLPGVLGPSRVVDISAEVAGRVEELVVQEGRRVEQGQVPVSYTHLTLPTILLV